MALKISDVIEGLKNIQQEHGDLECYFATDDEGNSYYEVNYQPTLFFRPKNKPRYRPELISGKDCEYDKNRLIPVCVIN